MNELSAEKLAIKNLLDMLSLSIIVLKENQDSIQDLSESHIVKKIIQLFEVCEEEIKKDNPNWLYLKCLTNNMNKRINQLTLLRNKHIQN